MNELKDLELDEISVVDAGANPEAHIVMFKRKQEENSMVKNETAAEVVKQEEHREESLFDSLSDSLSKSIVESIDITKFKNENDALKARVAELEKALAERDEADKAAVEKTATDKLAADNAALAETLERLKKRLEDEIEKRENNELMKIAAKYELIGENADNTFKLLKSLKGTEGYDLLIGTFDKVLESVNKSGTFEEIGKSGVGSQVSDINKIADGIQKNEPQLTRAQAIDKAYLAHPELQD